jgi:thiol-disulfide isomerase/thioredoxin
VNACRLLASLPRSLVLLAVALVAHRPAIAAPPAATAPNETAGGTADAESALEQARLAYRNAGAFRETMDLTLTLPDGRQEKRRWEYGVDPAGGAFMALSHDQGEVFRIVARQQRMVATQFNIASRYAEAPYRADFAAALREMGGEQAQMAAPPAMVARQGGSREDFLAAFRLGILAPLTIAGFHPPAAVEGGGSPAAVVELAADNGRVSVAIDASSHRLRHIAATLGEGKQQVRAAGGFTFTPAQSAIDWPDLSGRTGVRTLTALDEASFPLGQPAPQVVLRSLDGETLHPSELAGSVVVLDFWATWCVPCWTALGHTSELAAWARASGLPVKVFAVDTLENTKTVEEQQKRVADFLRAKGIAVPVLLDAGGEAFAAFHHPGLPSLVILDRAGRLARYHSGLLPRMVETVRGEVQQLLASGKEK